MRKGICSLCKLLLFTLEFSIIVSVALSTVVHTLKQTDFHRGSYLPASLVFIIFGLIPFALFILSRDYQVAWIEKITGIRRRS